MQPGTTQSGQTIGPFRLTSICGTGRTGEVWLAESRETGAETDCCVALKIAGMDRREWLRREAAVLAAISSPHILRPVAADLDSDPAWLALPAILGPTLREQTTANGPFSATAAQPIFAAVLAAMTHTHAAGFLHGDIKPDHVLLDASGDGHGVWLIDFSHSRPLPTSADTNGDTGRVGIGGSPAYLPPEVRVGAVPDAAADVYAVGVTWFEALTGRLPVGDELPGDGRREVPAWADAVYAHFCADFESRVPAASAAVFFADAPLAFATASPEDWPMPIAATPKPPKGPRPLPTHLRQLPKRD